MGDVVDLDSRRPHQVGIAVCSHCGQKQVSVTLLRGGARPFQCGRCHDMTSDYVEWVEDKDQHFFTIQIVPAGRACSYPWPKYGHQREDFERECRVDFMRSFGRG